MIDYEFWTLVLVILLCGIFAFMAIFIRNDKGGDKQ